MLIYFLFTACCYEFIKFQVLKGHDDHVITCLEFCGNRIVSGSDDNTLKVWSADTGKVMITKSTHCTSNYSVDCFIKC